MSEYKEVSQNKNNKGKYLFCYFIGNEPDEETIRFAVSEDGYNYFALNDNKPIIKQTKGTLSMRDPFIFRMADGAFMIIATDMMSSDGWNSNHSMIFWKSKDLINWTDETIIDFSLIEETKSADRVWAPQVIIDSKKNKYMIYWSNHNKENSDGVTAIWYAYTSDFKSLDTKPQILYQPKNGKDGIDADIIYKDGRYYLYYKDEYEKTICLVTSDSLDGVYDDKPICVAATDSHVEGNCVYKLDGTDTYVMIMDKYTEGKYFMQQTEDMIHFYPVKESEYTLNMNPRHGSIMQISDEEYYKIVAYYHI